MMARLASIRVNEEDRFLTVIYIFVNLCFDKATAATGS